MFLYLKSIFYFLFKQDPFSYKTFAYYYSFFKALKESKKHTKHYTKEYYETYLKLNDDYIPSFKEVGKSIDDYKQSYK
jgi:hypothetical protein